ncbi:hypothetical protein CLOM_g772, partial [Closterium sp. NIES-68]
CGTSGSEHLVIFGGYRDDSTNLETMQPYALNLATMEWRRSPSSAPNASRNPSAQPPECQPVARNRSGLTKVGEDTLLLTEGTIYDTRSYLRDVHALHLPSLSWSPVRAHGEPAAGPSGGLTADGLVAFGGCVLGTLGIQPVARVDPMVLGSWGALSPPQPQSVPTRPCCRPWLRLSAGLSLLPLQPAELVYSTHAPPTTAPSAANLTCKEGAGAGSVVGSGSGSGSGLGAGCSGSGSGSLGFNNPVGSLSGGKSSSGDAASPNSAPAREGSRSGLVPLIGQAVMAGDAAVAGAVAGESASTPGAGGGADGVVARGLERPGAPATPPVLPSTAAAPGLPGAPPAAVAAAPGLPPPAPAAPAPAAPAHDSGQHGPQVMLMRVEAMPPPPHALHTSHLAAARPADRTVSSSNVACDGPSPGALYAVDAAAAAAASPPPPAAASPPPPAAASPPPPAAAAAAAASPPPLAAAAAETPLSVVAEDFSRWTLCCGNSSLSPTEAAATPVPTAAAAGASAHLEDGSPTEEDCATAWPLCHTAFRLPHLTTALLPSSSLLPLHLSPAASPPAIAAARRATTAAPPGDAVDTPDAGDTDAAASHASPPSFPRCRPFLNRSASQRVVTPTASAAPDSPQLLTPLAAPAHTLPSLPASLSASPPLFTLAEGEGIERRQGGGGTPQLLLPSGAGEVEGGEVEAGVCAAATSTAAATVAAAAAAAAGDVAVAAEAAEAAAQAVAAVAAACVNIALMVRDVRQSLIMRRGGTGEEEGDAVGKHQQQRHQ